MIATMITALSLGALGSTHCVGMCGPIAWSLPVSKTDDTQRFFSTLLYNAGRVVSYIFIGLLFGLIGQSFFFAGLQQAVTLVIGLLILLFVFFPGVTNRFQRNSYLQAFFKAINNGMSRCYKQNSLSTFFYIGVFNGFLPCGLVYMAVAGALLSSNIFSAMSFMLFFGLGTLPLMWAFTFFGQTMGLQFKSVMRKFFPIVLTITACILLLRGVGIDVYHNAVNHQPLLSRTMVECRP